MRTNCVYGVLLLLLLPATAVINASKAQDLRLPSPDSFRTANLFFLPPQKQLLYYQNAERILPTNKIEAGAKKYFLVGSPRDFSEFSFTFLDTARKLSDFIKDTKVVGLIIIKNDTVLLERYSDGLTPQSKWINFSVAKSVTSLLYGAAMKDGYITSLDEKVTKYIPDLAGSVYDSVSLRNLLQMSSGVAWNEDPRSLESDLMKLGRMEGQQGWRGVIAYLSQLKRAAPPGQRFNYNTVETSLAGLILKNVIKKPLAEYLSEKIWKPFGMHSDANWVKSKTIDTENGGCCISATLRDYALLGLFSMKNIVDGGTQQVLPADWMRESTTPARSNPHYGYYWWLRTNGRYFASGAFGQQIEIDPAQKIVIAVQSYWPAAFNNYYIGYMDAMIEAMMRKLRSGSK
jgi:CubicO group peptidase (beta-lactamase class C family)